MELVQSDRYKKINKKQGWETITCPICGAEWFARGEYWNCPHLIFTACTYFGFDLNYVQESYRDGAVIQEMEKLASNHQMHLQLNNTSQGMSFDGLLLKTLSEYEAPEISHVLVDPYVAKNPDTPSFITIFGYKTP